MATHMKVADLKLVAASHPQAQKVAVLNQPYDISLAYAEIPHVGEDEVRVTTPQPLKRRSFYRRMPEAR